MPFEKLGRHGSKANEWLFGEEVTTTTNSVTTGWSFTPEQNKTYILTFEVACTRKASEGDNTKRCVKFITAMVSRETGNAVIDGQADGFSVNVNGGTVVLDTDGSTLVRIRLTAADNDDRNWTTLVHMLELLRT